MSDYPAWFDEDTLKEGILIVGIYFKVLKDYVQNEAREWLLEELPEKLKAASPETSIEPLEYALTRYISPAKKRGRAGKAKGGEYKYLIENATPKFYEALFEILEKKKEKGKPEWFGDYYILIARRVIKDE